MADLPHIKYLLPDRTFQGFVRSELKKMAESIGFTGHRLGEVEIIVAEIASNLVKHTTKGGHILVKVFSDPSPGIEFISIDAGPGMNKPVRMLEDGVSTSNTLGQGLGAISRLSSVFDLYSLPRWGTILYSRIYLDKKFETSGPSLQFSAIRLCKKNETVCGDLWTSDLVEKNNRMVMIDGLGHGAPANMAAEAAASGFRSTPRLDPVEQLRALHEKLKKTRGAVITVAYIDEANTQLSYCGVGNITMKLVSATRSNGCLSYNGIVGHIIPHTLNIHNLQMDKRTDTVVMHSDGLSGRWDLQKYPGILQHTGIMLCAVLYKDFDRNNDDSTILVARFAK